MKKTQQLSSALNKFYENPIAKTSLELFFSIGLVLFLAFFAIQPTLVTMSNLIKEIEDKSKLNNEMSKKLAALASAQTEYAAVRNELILLDQAIPTDPDIVYKLKTIEKIAAESDIIINSMAVVEMPTKTPKGTSFDQLQPRNIPIRANITGDYQAIRSFVESLINNRQVFVTDSVSLSVASRTADKSLQATISINVPYYGL